MKRLSAVLFAVAAMVAIGLAVWSVEAATKGKGKSAPAATSATPAQPAAPASSASTGSAAANLAARTIRGRLTPPERVLEAYLWDRAADTKVPVSVDPKTGAFEAARLRLGTYDFVLRTPWGRIEGLDMQPKVSEYDVLIPPEYRTPDLGLPGTGALSDADAKEVRRIIYEVKRYENKIRDLALSGNSSQAVALMELAMDGPFHGRQGDEIVWRIEQWYYEKKYDAWEAFRTRVLYRFRVSKAEQQTWGWQFEPALGGFDITDDRTAPVTVEYAIPDKPDPAKGLTGNKVPPAEKGMPKEPPPPAPPDEPLN